MLHLKSEGRYLAALVSRKTTAPAATPESDLVQEDSLITPTLVETEQHTHQIMETNTSKPWVIFKCSDNESVI